jgi:hypothetical protein
MGFRTEGSTSGAHHSDISSESVSDLREDDRIVESTLVVSTLSYIFKLRGNSLINEPSLYSGLSSKLGFDCFNDLIIQPGDREKDSGLDDLTVIFEFQHVSASTSKSSLDYIR